jgi:hypothetical protein
MSEETGYKTRFDIAHEEITTNPIFILLRASLHIVNENDLEEYMTEHIPEWEDCGWEEDVIWTETTEYNDAGEIINKDRHYLTIAEARNIPGIMIDETPDSVFLTREEGERYLKTHSHHFPHGSGRIYCVNAEGSLIDLLNSVDKNRRNLAENRKDILQILQEHIEWSTKTFGEGDNTEGLCKHIEKELGEIRDDPQDPMEWVDVIILAFDGLWRLMGPNPEEMIALIQHKEEINFLREWHVENFQSGKPIEHVREDGENDAT